jgi:hypothetical protein
VSSANALSEAATEAATTRTSESFLACDMCHSLFLPPLLARYGTPDAPAGPIAATMLHFTTA